MIFPRRRTPGGKIQLVLDYAGKWMMLMTHLTKDARKVAQGLSVVHPFFMGGWPGTSFVMKVDPFIPCKVTTCAPRKGRQIGSNSWLVW